MSDDTRKFDDNKEAGSKSPRQYYVEGYYDSAFSAPAELEDDYSYKVGASSALPAFPPQASSEESDNEKLRPMKLAILTALGLIVVLFVLTVARIFLKYDLEISSQNGTINITLTESKQDPFINLEILPTASPSGSLNHGDENPDIEPAPGEYKWSGTAMSITELPSDAEELTYQQIYKKCIDSIVSVYAINNSGQNAGTGIILSSDGYIVTNEHIVGDSSDIIVVLSNRQQYQAVTVGRDEATDLAVLKINAKRLKPAEFGDSLKVNVGDTVIAIGNPLNYTLMMTDGIISAVNDKITLNGYKTTLLQTNVELGKGSSGGALINCFGQIVGITNMKIISTYFSTEGIGFALPVSEAKVIIEELLVNGYIKGRPSLGIVVKDVPRVASVFYETPTGVCVDYVWDNSDACSKGLIRGDIIVSANDIQIKGHETLLEIQNSLNVGDTIELNVFRQGQYYKFEITLMDASVFD